MELRHIDIVNLTVSAANMRGRRKPDIGNILPSVRARGIIVPLVVRPNGAATSQPISHSPLPAPLPSDFCGRRENP